MKGMLLVFPFAFYLILRRPGGLRVAGALCAPPARNVRSRARWDDLVVVCLSTSCVRLAVDRKVRAAPFTFQGHVFFDN
jgi:hypothetical protein